MDEMDEKASVLPGTMKVVLSEDLLFHQCLLPQNPTR